MSQSNDRLTVTVFLAGLFHLIVILGVTFAPPVSDPSIVPTLEVLLIDNSLPESAANDQASYLAARTQQGSGNAADGRTREPGSGAAPEDAPGETAPGREPLPEDMDTDDSVLASAGRATRYVSDPVRTPLPKALDAGIPTPFAGADPNATLALKGRERRELLVTPSTRASDVAVYLDAWKRRIEQVGTLNFPNEARRRHLSGNPLVLVVLASNGGLVRADVRRSSGHAELDQAAMDILKLATPFEAFPQELAARYDVLRFSYEWEFVAGRLTGSAVELPAGAAGPE
ncbi:MAG TPA: TonB family protein [Steroidobacteraceae bacterium]|nr:TonB family protein [Steroidobacteraceae bacterium]